jgi:hypothetical protein
VVRPPLDLHKASLTIQANACCWRLRDQRIVQMSSERKDTAGQAALRKPGRLYCLIWSMIQSLHLNFCISYIIICIALALVWHDKILLYPKTLIFAGASRRQRLIISAVKISCYPRTRDGRHTIHCPMIATGTPQASLRIVTLKQHLISL